MAWGWNYPSRKGYRLDVFSDVDGRAVDNLGFVTSSPLAPYEVKLSDALEVPALEEIPADRRIVVATVRPAADVVASVAEIFNERLQRT